MDVDQLLAQLFQHGQGHGRIVDEGTALAGSGQFATDDGVFGILLDIILSKERLHLVAREVEVGLDDALVGPLLQGLRVGTLS